MNYQGMMGGFGSSIMFFSWITYIIVIILLILGIAALWKYINSK